MKICHVPEQKWPEEYAENQHQVKPTIVFGEESVTSARINLKEFCMSSKIFNMKHQKHLDPDHLNPLQS
jgi:hypothetical protein